MDIRIVFLLGAAAYFGLELLWRGRSHIMMALAGGFCTVLLYDVYTHIRMSLIAAFLSAMLLISAVEFIFGFVCNIHAGMKIWDYSRFRFNLYGQVCLPYSLLWGLLGSAFWAFLL